MRTIALALILCVLAPAVCADDPAATARAFFDAYAAGDVARASSFWSASGVEVFHRDAERVAAGRCFSVRDVQVRVDGTRVELDADVITWSALTDAIQSGRVMHKSLDLVQEEGAWKIAAMRDREEALADAIAAGTAVAEGTLRTPMLARLLTRRVITMLNRNEFANGTRVLAIAEEIANETGDAAALAEILSTRGTFLRRGPEYDCDAALRVTSEGVAWAEAAGDPEALVRALLRFGRARAEVVGWIDPTPYEQVVALRDRVDDPATIAHAYAQLAAAANDRGDHRGAFRYSMGTLRHAEESGDASAQTSALLNLAGAFDHQSDAELAMTYYTRAANVAREAGFDGVHASALERLARLHNSLGRPDEMLKIVEPALEIAGRAHVPDVVAQLHLLRASHFASVGNIAAAEADLNAIAPDFQSQSLFTRNGRFIVTADILMAKGCCVEAYEVAKRICLPGTEGVPCTVSSREIHALMCLGRRAEAIRLAIELVDGLEATRAFVVAETMQRHEFLDHVAYNYFTLAELLVADGRAREALAVAQRLKGRVLVDAQNDQLITTDQLQGLDRRVYRELNDRVATLNRALLDAGTRGDTAERLRADLQEARRELREMLVRSDAALAQREARPQRSILEDRIAAPPEGVLAIDYLITNRATFAFAIRRGASGEALVDVRILPAGADEIHKQVDRYVTALEQRDVRFPQHARALYDLLLGPFEPLMAAHHSLCVLPAGALWRLPFHALQTRDGRYLVEKTNLFYAPSLVALSAGPPREERRAAPTLLALANPHLRAKTQELYRSFYRGQPLGAIPETEREVRALASIYGPGNSRIYVGDEAQESVLKRESKDFNVLHIATHGILDEKAPMFSALALSASDAQEDGLLEAREIAELQLGADLAVLSACDTGRGGISAAEGILGLSWALLAAGCPTAVVSQWRADSASTAELMIAFHRDLVRTKRRSPVASLRRAQLALMRRNPHPYYWAPFIVVGRGH